MVQIRPEEIPRPGAARDGGVRASPALAGNDMAVALSSFSRDMGIVAGVAADLKAKRQDAEDNMFLDSYQLEYNKRAAAIETESLNSPEISDPKFVDILDKKLADAQKQTYDEVLTKGGFTPSDNGRTKANEIAMGLRTSTARSATGKAHNQRVESLLLSADENINEIARGAAAHGDLEGGLKRIDSVITSISGVVAPEKAKVLREAYRKTLVESVVEGHLARKEYDKAQAIVDAETGFFKPDDTRPTLTYPDGDGLIEKGNVDLNARPSVITEGGEVATLRSVSVNIDGQEILIPTVTQDGKIVSEDVALEAYKRTGQHLGKFKTAEAATAYAKKLSEEQGQRYKLTSVQQIVFDAAKNEGVDPAVALAIANVESGFDPNAKADTSSAAGIFQFTKGTARDFGLPADARDASIEAQAKAGARLIAANASALRTALGGEPTPTEIYMAHFLGSGDAIRVLRADEDTPLTQILVDRDGKLSAAFEANPFLKNLTAGGLHDWAAGKMKMELRDVGRSIGGREVNEKSATLPISDAITLSKRVTSARREQKADIDSLINDDVASIRATGTPIGIDETVAKQVLTPKEQEDWQGDREDARAYYDATSDMSLLAEDEIMGRVDALEPRAGEVGFARAEKVHTDVKKEADRIITLRSEDPALSVADVPAVVEAGEAFDGSNPGQSWQSLLKAREAAQKQVGIPEELRNVLTKAESKRLAGAIKGATDADFFDRFEQMARSFDQTFGDYADEALKQVMEDFVRDKDHRLMAANIIKSLVDRKAVPVSDAKALDDAAENSNIDTVTKSLSDEEEELLQLRRDPSFIEGQRSAIEAARTGAGPSLAPLTADQTSIDYLRKHPESMNDFISVYGEHQVPADLRTKRGRP